MTWIDNLKNTNDFVLNDTLINNTNTIISKSIENQNTMTNDTWFLFAISVLFIVTTIYLLSKGDQDLGYDFPRSLLVSSLICLTISIIAVLTPLANTFTPIIYLSSIFVISFIAVYSRKKMNK